MECQKHVIFWLVNCVICGMLHTQPTLLIRGSAIAVKFQV